MLSCKLIITSPCVIVWCFPRVTNFFSNMNSPSWPLTMAVFNNSLDFEFVDFVDMVTTGEDLTVAAGVEGFDRFCMALCGFLLSSHLFPCDTQASGQIPLHDVDRHQVSSEQCPFLHHMLIKYVSESPKEDCYWIVKKFLHCWIWRVVSQIVLFKLIFRIPFVLLVQ